MNPHPQFRGSLGADRKQYILKLLSRFKQSGLTRSAFAEREGINTWTLDAWRRRFESTRLPDAPDSDITFVEATAPVAAARTVEIVLSGDRTLRVADSISRESLLRFVETLES